MPADVAALAALVLLPGHPRGRQLQDRFDTGPPQDIDKLIAIMKQTILEVSDSIAD